MQSVIQQIEVEASVAASQGLQALAGAASQSPVSGKPLLPGQYGSAAAMCPAGVQWSFSLSIAQQHRQDSSAGRRRNGPADVLC